MQATPEDIEALYEVQQVDLDTRRLEKRLEELPQRTVILNCRNKRTAIQEKLGQIESLRKETNKKLVRINDEDASLEKKEKGVQAAIEAAGNDFRNAEARTKELNGIFKRRGELAESRESVDNEMRKIKQLEAQVRNALSELDTTENDATESFRREGAAIMKATSENKAKREHLLSGVSPEVVDVYNRTSVCFDTVSIGKLEGNACSVCRAKIEQGRLIDLMNQAPLATCPACKRLMIIEAD